MTGRQADIRAVIGIATLALLAGCTRSADTAATPPDQNAEASAAAPATSGQHREPVRRHNGDGSVTGQQEALPEAPPPAVTLPEGTPLKVRTTNTLSTENVQAGDSFTATLERPLVKGGRTIAPRGATVEGKVVEADKGGRVKGRAQLAVTLTRLRTAGGRELNITTSTFATEAKSEVKKDAAKIGIGAGIGAAIGAIAGGGKGAAIGAATGGGAGTGLVLATRGDAAQIPAETVLDFELRAPLTVNAR